MILELGKYVQDNMGTQWLVTQEVRHYESPLVTRCVLKERCVKDPRSAICKNDGTELVGPAITADHIISVCGYIT